MNITHYKFFDVAWAPDAIASAINKYTKHTSHVIKKNFRCIPENTDIIHFHNKYLSTNKKSLIQYHSEPGRKVDLTYKGKSLVIAQYHATLPEYKDCHIVRNIIDYEDNPLYDIVNTEKIRIGYSPSQVNKLNKWCNKGYNETKLVLDKLKNEKVDVDIITKVPLEECIKRKARCNIIIDECVTTSYHRSGLEGLALGKLTICSLGKEVENIIKTTSGSDYIPFHNIWIDDLEQKLNYIINKGIDYIKYEGAKSRKWFEQFWNPRNIIQEYIKVYKEI